MGNPLKRLIYLVFIGFLTVACTRNEDIPVSGNEFVNSRFEQSMEWNTTHPYREIISATDTYTILSIADMHVGSTDNLDKFFKIADSIKPISVVMAGDLTNGHASEYALFEQHLPNIESLPLFLMVGNHDLHFDGWSQFFARFGSSTYYFTIKTPLASDLYICLDTGSGTLGSRQYNWLCSILQTLRPGYRICTVYTHNNLFRYWHAESTSLVSEEVTALLDLFTTYKVRLFIAGHDHTEDATLFGNTTYIVTPSLKGGIHEAGYFECKVDAGEISYKFQKL